MRRRDQVVELRNYRTQPGQRDTLIDLFEREFIDPQEALGASVLGAFRDIDDPDRFVWLRGFADFDSRFTALDGFYSGEVWKRRRAEANAAMINSDDVLLLRPLAGGIGRDPGMRPPIDAPASGAIIVATTCFPAPGRDALRRLLQPRRRADAEGNRRRSPRHIRHRTQPQQLSAPAGARERNRVRLACAL